MGDIARETGLSPMTVSRVLSNRGSVSEAKRKRVLATAKRLNYHVDIIARQLRAQHTFQLGVVAPFQGLIGTVYLGHILQGIQQVLTGTDYHIALFDSLSEDFNDVRKCVNLCHERRVGGLIVVAPELSDRFPETFANLQMPIIVVGSSLGQHGISYVDVDNYGGACAMTQHMYSLVIRESGSSGAGMTCGTHPNANWAFGIPWPSIVSRSWMNGSSRGNTKPGRLSNCPWVCWPRADVRRQSSPRTIKWLTGSLTPPGFWDSKFPRIFRSGASMISKPPRSLCRL